jgi:CMP-N-acetylneuraminic acid synthetase
MKIIAEIPARAGSQRVKNKNMRPLNGRPMISYAIEAAKASNMFSSVFVNTDSDEIGEYGKSLGVEYYKRPHHLASDTATSEDYNYDFIKHSGADVLVQVNPVNPFVTKNLIDETVKHFLETDSDSLITVREERFQAFFDGSAVNFNIENPLPRTQDLIPIQLCAWPVTIWRTSTFIESYEKRGHAVFSGKLTLYPISFLAGIKISYEEDFNLAEQLMPLMEKGNN